ncbi:GNAT family N-acetyltransferase [Salinirubrum litoreum]|uniref:GNAT family N-acetyltransferase n=1 Tax=Salinirubrum litoreum TaxID=1126234 RepID=A0ABD5R8C6_9EURY
MHYRAYDPDDSADRAALWDLKRGFELGLGSGTGDDAKQATYEEKLTEEYRDRWLDWVAWCVAEDPDCITVAVPDAAVEPSDTTVDADHLAGYVFLLPERLAFVWDAAVLNELYLAPDYRGTGVADDLLDRAVAHAREQDLPLDRVVLDVDRKNERARAVYDRHGFEHWGEMLAKQL